MVIATTNIIKSVKNFNRISRNKYHIECVMKSHCNLQNIWCIFYRKMAWNAVHYMLSVLIETNTTDTLHMRYRKMFGNPANKKNVFKTNSQWMIPMLTKKTTNILRYNFPYQRNDYTLGRVIRCTFPMLLVQWHITTLEI